MSTIERTTVIGVFEDRVLAEHTLDNLHRAGFNDDDIGFVIRDLTTTETNPETIQRETATGAATGAMGGGVVGGLLGAAAALLIPGLGPALAGGILAVTLTSAALGAVAGSFVGALTGFGISEEDAIYYENELEMGRVIVTVKAHERYEEAFEILRHDGAYDASTHNNIQGVPLYNSAEIATTYDPEATIKSPAITSSRTPDDPATTQAARYSSDARQYDHLSDTENNL